jgi:hypothetical protein
MFSKFKVMSSIKVQGCSNSIFTHLKSQFKIIQCKLLKLKI